MGFKLIETIHNMGRDYEVMKCTDCGRTQIIHSGADIAYCDCEFENEGRN